jgi:hypothetical protein
MKNNRNSFLNATVGFLKLPSVAFYLFVSVREQKSFIKNSILPEIEPFLKNPDGSINLADIKKITGYYALGVPAILGYGFSLLRNKALSTKERTCMSYLGGISGLLDDLFDDPNKEVSHLESFISNPKNLAPKNDYETLLKHFYVKGLDSSKSPEAIQQQALKVFSTEQESKLQLSKELSKDKTRELTFLKGGHSFLFYRLCMNTPLEPAEKKMVYQLGGVMQMGNDVFDVWEDHEIGIQTLATQSTNIYGLRESFSEELDKLIEEAKNCNYPKKQQQDFIRIILLGLSRVFVCLDQFEKLQGSDTSIFLPEKYSRKQLICDMETFKNKKAAYRHYLRLHSYYL